MHSQLDPLDVLLNIHLGWAYLQARQYDASITLTLKAIAMDPNIEAAYTGLGRAYLGKKMYSGLRPTAVIRHHGNRLTGPFNGPIIPATHPAGG